MAFDWTTFLTQHHITYDTRGPNVSTGFVAIRCPFCGSDDPSRHMTVSMAGVGWRCWRNPKHRGGSPVRLIAALIHCSFGQARAMVGVDRRPLPDDLAGAVRAKLYPEVLEPEVLKLPEEFKRLEGQYSSQRFAQYLRGRGFDRPFEVAEEFDLRYAISGEFHHRLLFILRTLDEDVIAWTGRSIYEVAELRYKSRGPTDTLLWFDMLPRRGSDTFALCEGPFDALKISVLGRELGVDASCCFTSAPSRKAIDQLHLLLPAYEHRFVVLDRGEAGNMLWTEGQLAPLGVKPLWLPYDRKDPALLRNTKELAELIGLASGAAMR